jgi:hypothetical protein
MPATVSKPYETKTLGADVDATAPDGTAVRLLLSLAQAWRISSCRRAPCRMR